MTDRGGIGRVARRLARPFRGQAKPLTVTDRLDRWARRIAEFGVLDRPYLEAQTGRTFANDDEAIAFYVHNDGRRGLSLSPLIEPEWMRDHQPDPAMSWYDALHQESSELFQTGPVFDATVWAARPGAERPASTLDALRGFLRDATGATDLPVPPGRRGTAPTWDAWRRVAMDRAAAFADAQRRTRRRYRSTWDGPTHDDVLAGLPGGVARRDAEQPLVSVVMPVFRDASSVGRAVDSVRAQTYPAWELVVVDDGSPDDTVDVVRAHAADDDRIRVVQRPNGGAGAARNTGLEHATGAFVAFLDADNAWYPEHLGAAVAALLDDGRAPGVHTGVRMTGANNADDSSDPVVTYRGEDGTVEDLLAGNFVDLNALVVRRSVADAAGPFDTTLRRWIDWEWLLRIATRSGVPRYVPVLGVDYDNVRDPRRVSSAQPASWQEVALAPHRIDWDALAAEVPTRDDALVSVVMPTYRDWTMTRRAVDAVLAAADHDGDRVEVVVVDNGSPRSVSAVLQAWFGDDPRVVVQREDRNRNFALGSDLGLARSRGATVVMLNNDTEVRPGWLAPLVSALDDPTVLGAQPLLVYPDGVVQAAGTVFGGDKVLPWHFLADHPRYDADRVFGPGSTGAARRFSAITAAAAAFRAADLVRWHGFDPVYANGLEDVDMCLRAVDLARADGIADAGFVVVPSSVVVHHESRTEGRDDARVENRALFDERWRGRYPAADAHPWYDDAGLRFVGVEPGMPKGHRVMVRSSRPVVLRAERSVVYARTGSADPVRAATAAGPLRLRIAVKHDGARGRDAAALAAALRASGHDVAVDPRSAWYRGSAGLDDVVVWVPGAPDGDAAPFVPQPGAVNAVWSATPDPDRALHITETDPVRAAERLLAATTGS